MKKTLSLIRIMAVTCAPAFVLTARAETATVRVGYPEGAKGVRYEERVVELEKTGDASWRFTLPKAEIPKNAKCVEVVPSFMTARKGDDGYWMQARGTYGLFDKDDGTYVRAAQLMPVFGVKKGGSLWYGHVKTWRFNYAFVTTAKKGAYETFPRFDCAHVRRFFPEYYSDIVVEFHRLDGAEADYNGLAYAYRKYQLDRGAVRTIKDRLNPELDYLCDAIVVRIQTHAAKPIPETADGITKKFFKAGEELPITVHMPFGVTEEFLQALKDAGVDKLSICSAGWQDGGYDGRVPGHFPVCAEAGGEEAYRRLIAKAKALGYQFALHAANTDGYMCSRLWDEDWVCKFANGDWYKGGLWAGGQCYWVCQKCAWERWLPEEMRKMAALGIRGPHYIDVYSATYPKPCGDPKHPCTWEQTAEYENRILAEAKRLMGGAASESGYDHVAGNIDYINYIERDLKMEHEGKLPALATGVYPLWELVYHGIILYTSDRLTQNHTRGKCLYKLEKSGDPRWMEGDGVEDPYVALKIVEFGGRPIFYTYKFADVPRIKKAWDEFVPVRHLQREQMTEHRTLAPGVFLTAYGDGSKTVCNYTDKPYVHAGTPVQPMSYILVNPDGSVFQPPVAQPCANIRFEPMPRLMLYGDTTRLGRPFAKDPTVIRHDGKYFMYYSECSYAKDRVPKDLPKFRTWWWGGIATSTNLVDWTRVGNIEVEGAPETVGWVAPCVKKFDGKIHIFAQGHDAKGLDAPKANSPKSLNVLWHATSDDGIHFKSDSDKPAFIARNEWSLNRAIDAEVYRLGDRMMLMYATREYPTGHIQQLGMAWAKYGSAYGIADWHELSVKAPFFKPERPWEMKCIEAPTVIRRKGIWYMFYAGAYNHERQQIGVAWSADGVNFTRWRDEPVFPHGPEGSWNAWESGHPGIFEDDDGQVYLFFQGKATLKGDYRLSCVKVRFED